LNRNGQTIEARRRLADLLRGEGSLDVVEAALWVASGEYADLDVNREASRVRIICAEGARLVESQRNPFARLDGLREYLFDDLGFRGNLRNYNDPRNCYLNEVLNRRLGIPLTLSVLFMELARAAQFEARGVALPGHFVARLTLDGRTLFVDPFHGGQVITEEDCRRLVARTTGRASLFRREQLEGVDERATLARLLINLKRVYVEREDHRRALEAVDWLLLMRPGDSREIRDRGLLQAHLGRPGAAIDDLETYLTRSPAAPDAGSVRNRVAWLRRRMNELN
jgi:regulator of sirC expression with transglutaminase-like and TPR domain